MDSTLAIVAVIVAIALIFDFTNGFHDAANSIATVVSTRVLSPARAVAMAAFFNFVAFFLGTHAVAKTIYSGLVDPKQVNEWVVLAGLIGGYVATRLSQVPGLHPAPEPVDVVGVATKVVEVAGLLLALHLSLPRGLVRLPRGPARALVSVNRQKGRS